MMNNEILLNALMSAIGGNKIEETGPKVKIVKSETGQSIRLSEKKPDSLDDRQFGYIVFQQLETKQRNRRWFKTDRRQCIMLGTEEELQDWLKDHKGPTVPGRIVVQEYRESEIPEDLMQDFFGNLEETNPELFYEQYEKQVKRAGNDGPELYSDGERIITFKFLDTYNEEQDIFVQHDNGDEVSAFNRLRREKLRQEHVEALKKREEELKKEEKQKETTEVTEKDAKLPK